MKFIENGVIVEFMIFTKDYIGSRRYNSMMYLILISIWFSCLDNGLTEHIIFIINIPTSL